MACEACNVKFSFFTRKKQCMDCLRYFCSECVIKRIDKILSCDSCSILSRRPVIRSLIIQIRSKDIRWYLLAKKVPLKGCIEKEDLINLLLIYANGSSDHWNTDNRGDVDSSLSDRSTTRNYEHGMQVSDRTQESDATRIEHVEIPETIARVHFCPDEIYKVTNPVKLSDINTLSELEYLSVKQLKSLLSTNRVDYKGCIEKHELLNRASRLWEEYKQSRIKMEIPDENLCKICWDEPIECVILECGHMACCLNCGKQMSECPICKQYVVRVVRSFKA